MKSIAIQIAEHFGCDVADIRDHNYQPGLWTRKVYAGMDGNRYWSADCKTPPKRRDERYFAHDGLVWRQVPSNFPGNPPLWVGEVPAWKEPNENGPPVLSKRWQNNYAAFKSVV